jgi:hypothetical protein
MVIARQVLQNSEQSERLRSCERSASFLFLTFLALCVALLGAAGCGQTAKPVVSPATGQVDSYFGGPFNVSGSFVARVASNFDHSANQIAVSGFIPVPGTNTPVPVNIISGTFASADTGFLGITESFATTSTGIPTSQNPSITGAWAVEIPGAGALANLLRIDTTSTPATTRAAPIAMAQNTACPNFSASAQFLYVTVPNVSINADMADYGIVGINSQGSAVTFSAQPFLVGSQQQPASTVTGGCSQTNLGALTAYPLNSFAQASNLELISIGNSGLLVSSFNQGVGSGGGAFGGKTGVIGLAEPSSPVDVSSVVAAQYNGFIFSPLNTAQQPSFDITVLASAFGNHTASSQPCSALQASLAANTGNGNGSVPVLPSANSLYGGEFLTITGTATVNDPTGANGSENCDVAVDLGTQDSSNDGLFPNATIFIGSTFPPFSVSNPWTCGGTSCAVSFPAAAIVGQVQGKFVIFVSASGVSSPPAELPNGSSTPSAQPVGIYLFQKAQ